MSEMPPRRVGRWSEFTGRFAEAISNVFLYVFFGMAVGIALLLISQSKLLLHGSSLDQIVARLLEHVGMGFVVAAIAVLFYEWGAHVKDTVRMTEQLTALREAVADQALRGALRVSIQTDNPDYDNEMTEAIISLVTALKVLHDQGDWAQPGFQRYLTAIMQRLSNNATRLAEVSAKLRHDPISDASCKIAVLTPPMLVDIFLAEQVARLSRGRYSVATNPQSWRQNQLSRVFQQCRLAVEERGVTVRRVFVLAERGPQAHGLHPEELRDVLQKHVEAAHSWHRAKDAEYAVKVLDAYELSNLERFKDDAAVALFSHQFAIFETPESRHALKVEAIHADLSELSIEGLSRDARELKWFDEVWAQLPELNDKEVSLIVERAESGHSGGE